MSQQQQPRHPGSNNGNDRPNRWANGQSDAPNAQAMYNDPASLLSMIPFAHYTPTARVAEHFAPHTVSYTPPTSAVSVYPQHAQAFQALEHPQTADDWTLRQSAQDRVYAALQSGTSYGNQPYASPQSINGAAHASSPVNQPFVPLPYTLLPRTPQAQRTYTQPPTPSSSVPSPAPSATEYFEQMLDHQLSLHHSPSPAHSSLHAMPIATPTAIRRPSVATPGPLGSRSEGPSPSKKPRTKSSGASPAFEINPPILTDAERASYTSLTASGPGRSTASIRSTPRDEEDEDDDEDDIDWGDSKDTDGDWHMGNNGQETGGYDQPSHRPVATGRTGDKDQRSLFQKVQNLLEDIFEELDGFSANPTFEEVSQSRYFHGLSASGEHPLLSPGCVDKLVQNFSRLHKSKRSRQGKAEELPWDADTLSRLLRVLERSMQDGMDLDPFPGNGRRGAVVDNASPIKGTKGRKGKKAENGSEPTPELDVTEEEKDAGERTLSTMSNAVAAVLCALVVLRTHGLPKHLYSEDLLAMAVNTVRAQMKTVLFPVIEGLAGDKIRSNFLAWLVTDEASAAAKSKSKKQAASFNSAGITSIAHYTCAAFSHIAGLINRPNMSFGDQLIINTIYLSIGPIFVHEPTTSRRGKGKEAGTATWALMKTLRTEALGCLRVVFAKYESQRQWILQEILGQLRTSIEAGSTNTRYQLADGTSISTLSALFLQLVQAYSHGVGPAIRKLRSRNTNLETGEQNDPQATSDEESRICQSAIDNAAGCMFYLVRSLIQKSIPTKASRGAVETDFSGILSNLVTDLLAVVYRPEWPAAAMFLNVLAKSLLDEPDRIDGAVQQNAAKALALDYLGDIAARLRSLSMELDAKVAIPTFDTVIQDADVDGLAQLQATHQKVLSYLSAASREDGMLVSAGEMTRIMWASEVSKTLDRANSLLERLAAEPEEVSTRERIQAIVHSLRIAAHEVWNGDSNRAVYDLSGSNQLEGAVEASLALARLSPLQDAFRACLFALTKYMDASVVTQRSKALRGLSQVVIADPEVLADTNVRGAIEDRLADTSPSVRDAAVDLIGKYVVQRSELAIQYFEHLAARVTDSGLSVRKRVVKLLRDMFAATDNAKLGIEICCKLVIATEDEDDGIRELGIKSLTDILYPPTGFVAADSAALLVDVLHKFSGSTQALETAVNGVHAACKKNGNIHYFGETIDALINRMVDATEDTEFDGASHIRAIFLLSLDDPALIDTNKAGVLLSYLRPPSNSEEQKTNDQLLQIFVRSIPFLPKSASAFAKDLSDTLRSMATKPAGAPPTLRWTVAGYCVVVKHLTHAYLQIWSLLRGCHDKIRVLKINEDNAQLIRQVSTLYYITALIVENIDLDAIGRKDEQIARAISAITKRPLGQHFFELYIDFSSKVTNQQMPILCLSAVFRAHPYLILDRKTEKWMGTMFQSPSTDTRSRLLELIHDFLVSESKRRLTKGPVTKGINDLIGANNEVQESAVSTSLVQRTIEFVKDAAMSHTQGLQEAALNVLAFTVNQGLYHPVLLMPVLIPLETSEDRDLSENALTLHATLHTKHSSMLNVQHLAFVKNSYDYLRAVSSEVSGSRRGAAALAGWYGLLSEKRAWRLDFLRAIAQAFSFDLESNTPIDPKYVHYVAENIVLLDYQLQEEVMTVVQELSHVVRDGTSTANHIEVGQVDGGDNESIEGKMTVVSEKQQFPAERLANASLVVGIALLAKNLLLEVYSLTEDKCLKLERGKKSTVGDKPAAKKDQFSRVNIEFDTSGRLPLVRDGVETVGDYRLQASTFLELMREDGALGWENAQFH